MRRFWRLFGSSSLVFAMLAAFGDLTAPLLLLLAADMAVAARLAGSFKTAPANLVIEGDPRLVLLRRTVPRLRQRRPSEVIDLQVQWRRRLEARQRGRSLS
ncbi:MAG: hypothetical protein JO305_02305 [Alphaproteobacteria bacterium]|nr:hypothetical protein [Alphaproteobacteria bacterium]